jgi:hypothetical protein
LPEAIPADNIAKSKRWLDIRPKALGFLAGIA